MIYDYQINLIKQFLSYNYEVFIANIHLIKTKHILLHTLYYRLYLLRTCYLIYNAYKQLNYL